jgi:DNA-directed RNA polymerase specialized sigma24 family protein
MDEPADKTGGDLVRELVASPDVMKELAARVINKHSWFARAPAVSRMEAIDELQQDAAVALLKKAELYNPSLGLVRAWAYRVVENCFCDRQREKKAQKRGGTGRPSVSLSEFDPPDPTDRIAMVDAGDGGIDATLSDKDLNMIQERLSPVNRLVAVAIFGLVRNVPAVRWEAWQVEADLDELSAARLGHADADEKLQMLCCWTGKSRNSISQVRLRARKVFQELDFIKNIRRDHK